MGATGMILRELQLNAVEKSSSLLERFKIDNDSAVYVSGKYEGCKPRYKNSIVVIILSEISGETGDESRDLIVTGTLN